MQIKNLIIALGIVFGLGALAVPVNSLALQGSSDDNSSSGSSNKILESEKIAQTKTATDLQSKIQADAQKRIDEAKLNAQKRIDDAKSKVQQKTEEQKLKICQERSAQITQKITKKSADASKHLGTFTTILNRVKSFHDDKQLNTANYDALVANVDAKSANAQAAIDALKSFDTTIDCTKLDNVKASIASYVDALKQAHTALKEYRVAIKDLIVAVKQSAENQLTKPDSTSTNSTTTGAN